MPSKPIKKIQNMPVQPKPYELGVLLPKQLDNTKPSQPYTLGKVGVKNTLSDPRPYTLHHVIPYTVNPVIP